jgi:hypothetical protein
MYSVARCEAVLRRWGFTRVPGSQTEMHYLYQGRDKELLSVRKFDDLSEDQRIAVLRDLAHQLGEPWTPITD